MTDVRQQRRQQPKIMKKVNAMVLSPSLRASDCLSLLNDNNSTKLMSLYHFVSLWWWWWWCEWWTTTNATNTKKMWSRTKWMLHDFPLIRFVRNRDPDCFFVLVRHRWNIAAECEKKKKRKQNASHNIVASEIQMTLFIHTQVFEERNRRRIVFGLWYVYIPVWYIVYTVCSTLCCFRYQF